MKEREFLLELEKRALENKNLIGKSTIAIVGLWLGEHPWRIMIPFSFLVTLLLRFIFGKTYFDFVLRIFGGL